MKLLTPLLVCCVLSATLLPALAQRSEIRNAIKRKYEVKEGEPGKQKANEWIDNLNDVKVRKEYRLTQSITYVTWHYSRRGKLKDEAGDTLKTYANPKDKLVAMTAKGKENSIVIIDGVPRAQLIFNISKKQLIVLNGNAFMSKKTQGTMDEQMETGSGGLVKPMNRTKIILGYSCSGYERYDKKEVKTDEFWVAKINEFNGIGALNPSVGNSMGLVMETTHFQKEQPARMMQAVAISKSEGVVLRTDEYERLGMPHMQ